MSLGFIRPSSCLKQITFKAARIMGSMGGTGEFERVLAFVWSIRPSHASHHTTTYRSRAMAVRLSWRWIAETRVKGTTALGDSLAGRM